MYNSEPKDTHLPRAEQDLEQIPLSLDDGCVREDSTEMVSLTATAEMPGGIGRQSVLAAREPQS